MALKIRFRQQGRNNRPFYRLVVADSHSPRDGKYIEMLGWYNPFETKEESLCSFEAARIEHWLLQGAEISENAQSLLRRIAPAVVQGIRARKELQRKKANVKRRACSRRQKERAQKA